MAKKIGIALTAAIAVLFGYVALQPSDYTIARDIAIDAPPERIFPHLNSMRLAEKWGPWMESDPDAKMTLSGPESGIGAKESWTGGKQLGTGSATITESVPNERVTVALEYQEPMNMNQVAEYSIRADGARSLVTWKVSGKNSFFGRLMCTFTNMDKHVGSFFEKGLAKLKTIVEQGA